LLHGTETDTQTHPDAIADKTIDPAADTRHPTEVQDHTFAVAVRETVT
jgi:hypothetical protein